MSTTPGRTGLILLVVAVTTTGSATTKQTTMTGRIVAYRPVERVAQVASFVKNREQFLFQVEAPEKPIHHRIVKIDYQHLGYSDISEDMLNAGAVLKLTLARETAGDETFDQFVSSAPTLRDESSGEVTMSGVTFTEKFKDMKLAPDLALRCYALKKGAFEVVEAHPR